MRRRQPMPNNKLGLISPTIGFAIIAALPTPESGTATTMIQKASKKVLGRVQAAVLGYGQLYQTWVAAKAHSAGSSCS
jgi:hypothetical protein